MKRALDIAGGLAGAAPVDAAGSPNLRKRLRGVIQFLQDCAAGTAPRLYDFDRLRGKLGHDVVPDFTAHQDASHRARIADAFSAAPTRELGGRTIAQIGIVTLFGVND